MRSERESVHVASSFANVLGLFDLVWKNLICTTVSLETSKRFAFLTECANVFFGSAAVSLDDGD